MIYTLQQTLFLLHINTILPTPASLKWLPYLRFLQFFMNFLHTPHMIYEQRLAVGSGRNQFSPDPARKLSANLYDIYHCCVYSEKLLIMDRGTVRNM